LDIVFFGHDVSYSRLAFALADKLPAGFRLVFYCNKPGLAWFVRDRLGIFTVRAGCGRLTKRFKPAGQPPFKLSMLFYPKSLAMLPIWHAVAQWHYIECSRALRSTEPALFVCPGEYRITEQAFMAVIQEEYASVPMLFFEAGPGPYVYVDHQGVNANASFTYSPISEDEIAQNVTVPPIESCMPRNNGGRQFSAFVAKAVDLSWVLALEWCSQINEFREYVDALRNRYKLWKIKHNSHNSIMMPVILSASKHLLFVDQVQSDVNATHFGCSDSKIYSHIAELLESNPDWTLVWRPHPLERREELFNKIFQIAPDRVFLSNGASFADELSKADAVLTVNSNGGLDALLAGVPVLLFGASYYQQLPGVTKTPEQLAIAISTGAPSSSVISQSAEKFIQDKFISLDYRGQDFSNAGALARLLLSHIGHPGDMR
jgi:capsule polysaccharide modification protein KpsS